jgi:hypothetical protein
LVRECARGHGGVGGEQQRRHRLAEQIGTTDHHRVEAGEVRAVGLADEEHCTGRRAGNQPALEIAGHQLAGIDDMQAVDILLGPDRLDHRVGLEMIRQGQLHEDAMDFAIFVEPGHQRLKFSLRGFKRQSVLHRLEAALLGHPAFRRDIDMGSRVIANDDHCEAGAGSGLSLERVACSGYLFDHPSGDRLAVNHLLPYRVPFDLPPCGLSCRTRPAPGPHR